MGATAEATIAQATVARATVARATVARATVARATVARATVARATVARFSPLLRGQLPGEALPGEGLPGGALPGVRRPSGALPGGGLPGEALPGEGLPGDGTLPVTPLPMRSDDQNGSARRDRLTGLLAEGNVRSGREVGPDNGALPDADLLPVLPALRDLLPHGALTRGSVVSAGTWSLLCLALAAGPVAAGAWCAAAGIPELGVAAAANVGLDPARLLLVPGLGPNWPQVVISLLDGCDLVVLRPPNRPPAQARRKLEAAVRRHGAVLLVAGDWDGARVRLRVAAQEWAGIGQGHGRLRWRRAQVVADGRGGWSRSQARWLWLPGPDGTVTAVTGEPVLTPDTGQASTG